MKKIERPIATSFADEAIFHYCKTPEETKNAFDGVDPKRIHVWRRSIDPDTFQPLLMVMVERENIPINEWFKWAVPLELALNNDSFKTVQERGWQ